MIYKYFRFMLVPLLAATSLSPVMLAQRLTLSDAVDIALKNNERIHQYEERLKQKKYEDYETWGNFLPSLTFNGSYNHMNAPLEMDLSPVREAIIGTTLGGMQILGASAATLTYANAAFQNGLPADEFIVQLKKQVLPWNSTDISRRETSCGEKIRFVRTSIIGNRAEENTKRSNTGNYYRVSLGCTAQ